MIKSITVTVSDNQKELVLPSSIRRQAGIKPGDQIDVRVSGGIITIIPKLPKVDDDYTPEQRRALDHRIAEALDDVRQGRLYGPFDSNAEMLISLKKTASKLRSRKKVNKHSVE